MREKTRGLFDYHEKTKHLSERYAPSPMGLAGQVLYLAATAHGLDGTGIGYFYDEIIHEFMGLDEADKTFQSLYHFTVGTPIVNSRIKTLAPYSGLR